LHLTTIDYMRTQMLRKSAPWARSKPALLAGLCLWLVGCATGPEVAENTSAEATSSTSTERRAVPTATSMPVPASAQPETRVAGPEPTFAEVDGHTLYNVIVAELAGRRGQLPLAVKTYLTEARRHQDAALAERATRIAVFARDRNASIEAASMWLRLAPESPDPAQALGALLLRANRLDESAAHLGRAILLNRQGLEAGYARITNLLAREKDRRAAMAVMKRLAAAAGTRGLAALPARLAVAELASRFGDLPTARKALDAMRADYPRDERVAEYLARVLQGQKQSAAARKLLEDFIARHPDASVARMSYGRLLVGEQLYPKAAEQFQILLKQNADHAGARYALAIVLMQLDDFDGAASEFQSLLDRGQRRYAASYYLGQLAEQAGDIDTAIVAYQRVERGEFALNAQIRAAGLVASQGQMDSARANLQRLRRNYRSELVRLYRAEADLLVRAEDLEGALALYDQALLEKPRNTDLLYARAMVAARADRVSELERDLRDILSREPNNADALNALGYTLADKTDRYQEALALIERAVKLKPEDHYIIDSLGWVLFRLGRYQESAKQLRKAFAIRADTEVAAHLGEVLLTMGNKDEAREVLGKALESASDNTKLNELMRRLGQ
jgi:tetratricopeptide (TPR) repeat protein